VTPYRIAPLALAVLLTATAVPALAQAPAVDADSALAQAPAADPDSVLTQAPAADADSVLTPAPVGARATDAERQALKKTLRNVGRREIDAPRQWERRKNPKVAMLSNALLPGLGQTYNGRRLKVAVMVGFFSFYGGNMVLSWQRHEYYEALRDMSPPGSSSFELNDRLSLFYEEQAIDFFWWTGAVWLIGILDSWIDAHLYDVRAYTPDTPDAPEPGREDGNGVHFGLRARGDGEKYLTLTVGF